MSKYRCLKCGKVVERNSTDAKLRSICTSSGKMVWLKRLRPFRPRCKECRKAIRGAPFKTEHGNFCNLACADYFIPF